MVHHVTGSQKPKINIRLAIGGDRDGDREEK